MPLNLGYLQTARIHTYASHILQERKPIMARLSLRINKQKVTTWVHGGDILGISEQDTLNSILSIAIHMWVFCYSNEIH